MTKTFIIAEAGANHNRDWNTAINLIDTAVEAGADAVKFQTYSSQTLYASNTPDFAGYKNINKLIKDLELPRDWQPKLKQYCDSKGIEFMSTPFDQEAVDQLVEIGVKRMKIAGFESTDPRFVEMVAKTGLPIIMSAGIGFDFSQWGKYLDIFTKYGNDVTLLHCNNAYPTPMEDANVQTVSALLGLKGVNATGFSDHTTSTLTPSLAVANGATVIEKHYTLDRTMEGPDHPFALEPNELKEMVDLIRETEKALGSKNQSTSKSEQSFTKARRSIVSLVDLKAGDILSTQNITTKRPLLEDSAPASDYFEVLGQKVTQDIPADTPISKNTIPDYYESKTFISRS